MVATAQLRQPDSVIRLAPMSGVFASDGYVGQPDRFQDALLGFWATQHNNSIPVAPDAHEDAAASLHGLYADYREAVHERVPRVWEVLQALNKTGDVAQAAAILVTQRLLHASGCRLTALTQLWAGLLGRVSAAGGALPSGYLHFKPGTPWHAVRDWFERQHPAFCAAAGVSPLRVA